MKNKIIPKNLEVIYHDGYFEIINKIKGVNILTKKFTFGINVFIGERVKICNQDGSPMEELEIGDNVAIFNDSTIMVPKFKVLDYTKINNHFYAHGDNPLYIGYNNWIGSSVVLDTLGGLELRNNVGIGTQAQVYSHAKFGDTLYGCRIHSYKNICLEEDVWIGANSVITMATMANKSMLLASSVLTRDTEPNKIYAGIPAKDITEKTGNQFMEKPDYLEIADKLKTYLSDFYRLNPQFKNKSTIMIAQDYPKKKKIGITYFVVKERRYVKTLSVEEIAFIKYLLPEKGKFVPY